MTNIAFYRELNKFLAYFNVKNIIFKCKSDSYPIYMDIKSTDGYYYTFNSWDDYNKFFYYRFNIFRSCELLSERFNNEDFFKRYPLNDHEVDIIRNIAKLKHQKISSLEELYLKLQIQGY